MLRIVRMYTPIRMFVCSLLLASLAASARTSMWGHFMERIFSTPAATRAAPAPRAQVAYSHSALEDRVPSLPGWGNIDTFDMFSG